MIHITPLYGQRYFNDTLQFNSNNTTLCSMTLPTDSGIYVACSKFMDSTSYSAAYALIGFIDTLGNRRIVYDNYDPNNWQIVAGETNKLFLNENKNFVLGYSNLEDTLEYPRVKEISLDGQLLRDLRFDTIIGMGLFVKDFTRIYQSNFDKSYYVWSVTSFLYSDPENYRNSGPLLTILDKNFNVDTIIRYYFDPQKKWDYMFGDAVELDSGKWGVWMGSSLLPLPNQPDSLAKSYLSLLIIDRRGDILEGLRLE